jgi:hypothetical protein
VRNIEIARYLLVIAVGLRLAWMKGRALTAEVRRYRAPPVGHCRLRPRITAPPAERTHMVITTRIMIMISLAMIIITITTSTRKNPAAPATSATMPAAANALIMKS